MKRLWLCILGAVVCTSVLATAQEPANGVSDLFNFENGLLASGAYSNLCLGFSLPLPDGWEVNESVTANGKARHRPDKSLLLLYLKPRKENRGGIMLNAWEAGQTGSAQDFVSKSVRDQIGIATQQRELLREAYSVDYGGRHFSRSDYRVALRDGPPLYMAYVYTSFRGYFIGETIASASPEELEQAVNSLKAISFRKDQVDPVCVMGSENGQPPSRMKEGISIGSLIKKVPPDYPPIARAARVQGQVIMEAVINTHGDIEDLTLVCGHAMLAPSAMKAVKDWKYKPYLFQGKPVAVETLIVVNFSLSGE